MDTAKKIDIAFLWHMHQPYYKDSISGKYLLPWARLRGVKDYYVMPALLERFDNVKANFNLVPSLLEQIDDYVKNDASDLFLDLTVKRADSLEPRDKLQILHNFFSVNFKRFIEPNPRYSELLIKRGAKETTIAALRKAAKSFSSQDFLDLQALFNLSWFHSLIVDEDSNLKEIVEKGKDYTEEDKEYIVFKQKEILARIIPIYKRLEEAGRIEISITPFYHPILPLLCDTNIARTSMPAVKLPKRRFNHPEDARWHVEEAVKFASSHFGKTPRGMWPSEGSVSDEALGILVEKGIRWVATDEDILFNSLLLYDKRYRAGKPFDRRLIYRPYKLKCAEGNIPLVFRDKNLSDMISFSYNSWNPKDAAMDLLGHFRRISENLRRDTDTGLVTIAMDGENAWEYYENNGREFFETLYAGLAREDEVFGSATISEYLASEPPKKTISNIYPGSWIDHNFRIWIGEEQDNVSWEYLYKVRKDLVKFSQEAQAKKDISEEDIEKAWREFYVAEGSDWNWWYGGKAYRGIDNPFDTIYRQHLKNIYKVMKKPVPEFLDASIS